MTKYLQTPHSIQRSRWTIEETRYTMRTWPAHAVTYHSLGVKALIKQDIIHQVIAKTGLPRNKAEAAVDTVFESLKKALASGDRIELRGFGVFNVRPRKTGIGRNPRTGAEVTITPGKAVRFKPGKELHLLDS